MRKKILSYILIACGFIVAAAAQLPGINIPDHPEGCELPFEYVNRFMVVKIYLNGFLPCNFIFDTGAEHTIITKKEISDILGIQYEKEFKVIGADLKTELIAYLAKRVHLKFSNDLYSNQDLLVLSEDYMNLDEYTGMQIHGILGADAFSRGIVKINYEKKKIQLIKSEFFKENLVKYERFPMTVERSKPNIVIHASFSETMKTPVKLLMDTGANLGLLLYPNDTFGIKIPPKTIRGALGAGLGGKLFGVIGRINAINIGKYSFGSLACTFQVLDSTNRLAGSTFRNGILGNELLERFHVIVDYSNQKIYLKPNRNFKVPFKIDRSGISLIASGTFLNTYTVQYVQQNSPADEAGVSIGDVITKIGWISTNLMSIEELNRRFQGQVGKKIRLTIRKNGQKLKKTFYLRDLI